MPNVPVPIATRNGPLSGPVQSKGKGVYSAQVMGDVVTLTASNIAMSGINPYAELVLTPTFAPPLQYTLFIYETHRELDNLIIQSTRVLFKMPPDKSVRVEDSDGIHDVAIEEI